MSILDAISVTDLCARGSIGEAEVSALRRAFYEDGKIDAVEAERLFQLNTACPVQDASWADCFVEMLTDHVVNQAKPEGYVTAENATRLCGDQRALSSTFTSNSSSVLLSTTPSVQI